MLFAKVAESLTIRRWRENTVWNFVRENIDRLRDRIVRRDQQNRCEQDGNGEENPPTLHSCSSCLRLAARALGVDSPPTFFDGLGWKTENIGITGSPSLGPVS